MFAIACRSWSAGSARFSAAACNRSSRMGFRPRPRPARHGHHGAHVEPPRAQTLAIVETLTGGDLTACAAAAWRRGTMPGWRRRSCSRRTSSSARSTRSRWNSAPSWRTTWWWPAAIRSTGLRVDPADIRRACEVQARSHLLHLREGLSRNPRARRRARRADRPIGGAVRGAAREPGAAAGCRDERSRRCRPSRRAHARAAGRVSSPMW